jgi:hypothetical protein
MKNFIDYYQNSIVGIRPENNYFSSYDGLRAAVSLNKEFKGLESSIIES